ncbi:DUF2971 domain-containing protein [Lutibacter citreus]|uniref:DUF2971 domain-containing protein n=1 Tax=Lutibacter citreus TaxID=2138210 RepID=UPI000DBE4098|nr:DUF2971 domain-containing protein [Lutibacter citreus]
MKNTIYKYRGIFDKTFERDINSILENNFWSANPIEFNDVFETVIDNRPVIKLIEFIARWFGINSEKDIDFLNKNTDKVMSIDNRNGMYSLSKNSIDELLWAHYANQHNGYCIEYDLNILLNSIKEIEHYSSVTYSKTPLVINWKDFFSSNSKRLNKMGFNKSKRWEYEQEYRLITNTIGKINYSPLAIKSIYFGLRICSDKKQEIINSLKSKNIKFYQIEKIPKTYKLKATLI